MSTSQSPQEKAKCLKILVLDYISSEESGSESGSDEEVMERKKNFLTSPLPWRSPEASSLMESLDRKIVRRRSERAKEMCRIRRQGMSSSRPMPVDQPAWAVIADPQPEA